MSLIKIISMLITKNIKVMPLLPMITTVIIIVTIKMVITMIMIPIIIITIFL